ncbi:MAG: DUF2339 domain-containing protein [Dehalococcoidia bacterium]
MDEAAERHESDADAASRVDPAALQLAALAAFDARLNELDHATAAIEQRLLAIEHTLQLAAPSPTVRVAAPPPPSIESVQRREVAESPVMPPQRELEPRAAMSWPSPSPSVPQQPRRVARRRAVAWDDLERAASGRGLAWAGGLAILLGALFFLSLAISRGWIGPEARVIIGLVTGIVVTGLGDRLLRGGDRVLAPVLVAVGIGVWNLALVAGTRLYCFVPDWAALLGAAASALVAVAIAVRIDAQVIALYGIVTALAAPMLFAIPSARLSMAYLLVMLVGSTAIATARGWWWLPPAGFLLSEMQFFAWRQTADAPLGMELLAIASLSLLHLIAATGIDLRAHTRPAHVIARLLLVVNAAAFAIVGAERLSHDRLPWGFYLLAGFAAYAAVGVLLQRPQRGTTEYATTALALAVIFLTAALAVLFEGALTAIAWAIEAVVLVWLAVRYRSAAGFRAGAAVFGLAVLHLFVVEYDAFGVDAALQAREGVPFVSEGGKLLLALLVALAAAARIAQQRFVRLACTVVGFGLLIAALPYELPGLSLLAGWALLAVLALAADRFLSLPPEEMPEHRDRAWLATNGLLAIAAIAAGLAIHRAIAFEMPLLTTVPIEAGVPYAGQPLAATVILVLAALAAVRVTISADVRQIAGTVAILITAHLAAFMLAPAPTVAVWAALAVGAAYLQQWVEARFRLFWLTSLFLLAIGVGVSLVQIVPVTRLLVTAGATVHHPFLWSEATLALGALALAALAVAWLTRGTPLSSWLALGGGVIALYLLSVGIVDEFQGRVAGESTVAELRRQSQAALSVVWAVLGGLAIAAGLVRGIAPVRWFGLGLLALTTVKVFLYDLASLDAVYRVLSFIVLGVLLLLSAYAYRRLGEKPERAPSPTAAPDGAAPAIGPDVAAPRGDPSGDGGLMGALGRLQRWLD